MQGTKIAVIWSLNDRSDKICSEQIRVDEEGYNIMNQLKENYYLPSSQQKALPRSNTNEPAAGPPRYINTPYIKGAPEKLADC